MKHCYHRYFTIVADFLGISSDTFKSERTYILHLVQENRALLPTKNTQFHGITVNSEKIWY